MTDKKVANWIKHYDRDFIINEYRQQLIEKLEKLKRTEGIKGILGSTHRDGAVNEGFNLAIKQAIKIIKEGK